MRPSARDLRFIAYLQRLASGGPRGALADLAAELGKRPGTNPRSVRWLARWTVHVSQAEVARHHLIAALFAAHPAGAPEGNLGLTMAQIALRRRLTPSLERRFVALLEADAEDVGEHLRHIVYLARAADVPLHWAQLLADLRCWDDPLRRVQAKWARSFWATEGCQPEAHDPVPQQVRPQAAAADGGNGGEMRDVSGTALAAELCTLVSEP